MIFFFNDTATTEIYTLSLHDALPICFAAEEVMPRLLRTPEEMNNLLRGLSGGYVPAGPAGSPTRGLVDGVPTGRNFFSVDRKSTSLNSSHANISYAVFCLKKKKSSTV